MVPETRDGLSSWTQDCLSVGLFLMRRGKAESPLCRKELFGHIRIFLCSVSLSPYFYGRIIKNISFYNSVNKKSDHTTEL